MKLFVGHNQASRWETAVAVARFIAPFLAAGLVGGGLLALFIIRQT